MFVSGLYLMLNSIQVDMGNMFYSRYALFRVGGMGVTSGSIMIIFMIGIGMLFYNARNPLAWLVTVGSLAAMIVGVVANTHFSLKYMTAFDLILIIVLLCGGLGLLLSSMMKRSED